MLEEKLAFFDKSRQSFPRLLPCKKDLKLSTQPFSCPYFPLPSHSLLSLHPSEANAISMDVGRAKTGRKVAMLAIQRPHCTNQKVIYAPSSFSDYYSEDTKLPTWPYFCLLFPFPYTHPFSFFQRRHCSNQREIISINSISSVSDCCTLMALYYVSYLSHVTGKQ